MAFIGRQLPALLGSFRVPGGCIMPQKKSATKKKVRIDDLPKASKRVDRVSSEQAEKVKGGRKVTMNEDPTRT
jgi:hypothetical protein